MVTDQLPVELVFMRFWEALKINEEIINKRVDDYDMLSHIGVAMKPSLSSYIQATGLIVRHSTLGPNATSTINGRPVRCEIGRWNFNGSSFIAHFSGDGATEGEAYAQAEKDYYTPFVGNEDAMFLGN